MVRAIAKKKYMDEKFLPISGVHCIKTSWDIPVKRSLKFDWKIRIGGEHIFYIVEQLLQPIARLSYEEEEIYS